MLLDDLSAKPFLITKRIGVRAWLSYRTAMIEYPLCIEANACIIRYPVKGNGGIAGMFRGASDSHVNFREGYLPP